MGVCHEPTCRKRRTGDSQPALQPSAHHVWIDRFGDQLRELTRAWSSRRWPTGEAVIVSAAFHERRGSRGRTLFEPTIQFRYRFRDVDYIGHRIAFGDVATRDRDNAERVAARFAPGTYWRVSIRERRPEMSVLHPGTNRELWFAVCFFASYVTLAIASLVDAVKKLGWALPFLYA